MKRHEAEQLFYYLQINSGYSSECQECGALRESNKEEVLNLLMKFNPNKEPLPVMVSYVDQKDSGTTVYLKFNNGTEIQCLWKIDGSFNVEEFITKKSVVA